MPKFIYAFSLSARDKLLAQNYALLKSDEEKNIFLFENKENATLVFSSTEYVFSDVMTF